MIICQVINPPPPGPTLTVVITTNALTSTRYYSRIRTHLKSRFNLRLAPVVGDGNCLFRALSHIIFGDEGEHNNVRVSLINTFTQGDYISAFCGIQGYNEVSIQEHFNQMLRNYTWGTVNELIMLGMLARINVCYINAINPSPLNWAITDVYSDNTLSMPNDPIYEGKTLRVLFHSIGCSGPFANHYDAIYDL